MIDFPRMKCFKKMIPMLFALSLVAGLSSCGSKKEIGEYPGTSKDVGITDIVVSDFQIGDSWTAKKLSRNLLLQENNFNLSRAAESTLQIRTPWAQGTGVYLGEHNGRHLVGTNAHVLDNIYSCQTQKLAIVAKFTLGNAVFTCESLIATWADVDFAIFVLTVDSEAQSDYLETVNPLKFNFDIPYSKNRPLYSIGHGNANNPDSVMTIKYDEDCRIYSATNEIRRLKNPHNPDALKIPSFAIGCDISPGDSGSSVIDSETGDLIGVVWSTQRPKPAIVRTRGYMNQLRTDEDDSIWQSLAYAIPAVEIKATMIRWYNRTKRSTAMRERRQAVKELLNLGF